MHSNVAFDRRRCLLLHLLVFLHTLLVFLHTLSNETLAIKDETVKPKLDPFCPLLWLRSS